MADLAGVALVLAGGAFLIGIFAFAIHGKGWPS